MDNKELYTPEEVARMILSSTREAVTEGDLVSYRETVPKNVRDALLEYRHVEAEAWELVHNNLSRLETA